MPFVPDKPVSRFVPDQPASPQSITPNLQPKPAYSTDIEPPPAPVLGKSLVGELAQPFIDGAVQALTPALESFKQGGEDIRHGDMLTQAKGFYEAGPRALFQTVTAPLTALEQHGVRINPGEIVRKMAQGKGVEALAAPERGIVGEPPERPQATGKFIPDLAEEAIQQLNPLGTPTNIGLMLGAGKLPGEVGKAMSAMFGVDMTEATLQSVGEAQKKWAAGDQQGAVITALGAGVPAYMAHASFRHAMAKAATGAPLEPKDWDMVKQQKIETDRIARKAAEKPGRLADVAAGEAKETARQAEDMARVKAAVAAIPPPGPAEVSAQAMEQQLGAAEAANKSPQAAEALKARLAAEAAQPAPAPPKPTTPHERLAASIGELIDEKLKASGVKLPETPVTPEPVIEKMSPAGDIPKPIKGEPAAAGTEQKQPVPQPTPSAEVAPKPSTPEPVTPEPPVKPTTPTAPVVERKPAQAAYRDPKTGKIVTGKDHASILTKLGRKVPTDRSANRFGFVDAEGQPMTRLEAGAAIGKYDEKGHPLPARAHEVNKFLRDEKKAASPLKAKKIELPDLLQKIQDLGGIMGKGKAEKLWGKEKYEKNKSLWDDQPELDKVGHRRVFGGEIPPDQMATSLGFDSIAEMNEAISRASKGMSESQLEKNLSARDLAEKQAAEAELKQYEADRAAETAKGKKIDDSFDVSEFEPKPEPKAEPLTLESPTAEQFRTEELAREKKAVEEATAKAKAEKDAEDFAKEQKKGQTGLKAAENVVQGDLLEKGRSDAPLFEPPVPKGEEAIKYQTANPIVSTEPKIFTKEKHDIAVKRSKSRTKYASALVDPGHLLDLVEIGGYHVEKGVRTFAAWSKKMVEELGERVRPHLRDVWSRLQKDPRFQDPRLDPISKPSKTPSEREASQMVKAFTEPKSGERTKAIAERTTGITDRISDVVTQAEALRASLKAEAKGAEGGAKKMKRDVSGLAKDANSRVAEIRDGLLAHVDEALGDQGAREYRKIITRVMKPIDPTRFVGKPEAMTKMLHDRMKAAQMIVDMTNEKATTIACRDASALIRKLGGAAVKSERVSVGVKPELRAIINSDHRNLSTPALLTLAERLQDMVKLGEVTEVMRKEMLAKRRAQLEARFGTEKNGVHPLESHPILQPQPGESLTFKENLANRMNRMLNLRQRFGYTYPPINYVMDLMSARDYGDGLIKWLKGPVDLGYEQYTKTTSRLTGDLDQKIKDWNIDDKSSSRIAAYAEYKQAGGLENLIESGVKKEIISELEAKGDAYLTPNERKFYKYAQDKFDQTYPEVNSIAQRLYNREMPKVDNYWPRLSDWNKLSSMEVHDRLIDQRRRLSAKTSQGFTIQRTGGQMKVRLNAVDTFRRHMDDTAYYLTMQEDVHTLMQAVSGDKFKATYGDNGQFAIRQWLDAVAKRGGGDQGARRVEWIDRFMNRVNRATTSYRPFSQLKHISNAGIAQALIGPGWYAQGIEAMFHPRWAEFMNENAPSFKKRGGGDVYQQQGMKPVEYFVAQGSDRLNSIACFIGGYKKLLSKKGIEIPEEGPIPFDKDVMAEALVYSHGATASVFTKDLPLMRSQGALSGNVTLDRALTVFQGYLMERYGYFKRDFVALGIKEKDAAQTVRAASGLLLSAAIHIGVITLGQIATRKAANAIQESLTGNEPKEPKHPDIDPEKLAEEYTIDLVRNFFPLAGNTVAAWKYGSTGVPLWDMPTRGAKSLMTLGRSKTTSAKMKSGIDAASFGLAAAGVPGSGQAMQILRKAVPDTEKKKKSLAEQYKP